MFVPLCLLASALALATACTSSSTHRPSASVTPTANTGSIVNGHWADGAVQSSLPLTLTTGDARQLITITAPTLTSEIANGQAWERTTTGWKPYGPRFIAHLGKGGLSAHERESSTTTPLGSFTLTQAFGRYPNPGTRLPYFQTTPADWWISQPGTLYNTHQVCSSISCRFNTGSPNARLFYVTPQYDYAIVIDYNRHPVVQGLGSGIFLHVTSGRPTAGCVSIPRDVLATILRWLTPASRPRILIGVGS
jgi:L,D-peptidoglycan transpeptidase YkuD (ErfK/YbiS/YcfS/YnhG family)